MSKISLFILLFISLQSTVIAQSREELSRFDNLFSEKGHKHNWRAQLKDNKNEFDFIFSVAFVVYKELLSSQDVDACVFTPSCSVYAIESIKKNGAIIGYFIAIDRLTRCNPGRNKNMPIDRTTGKYYDPVE